MTTKASIVTMSHLSDAQEMSGYPDIQFKNEVIKNINFVKYIINQTGGDLTKEIDADKLWSDFIQQSSTKIYG